MMHPQGLTLRKEAIALAEKMITSFYEKTIHPRQLGALLSEDSFSWIGACAGEVNVSFQEAVEVYSLQRDMQDLPPMHAGPFTSRAILLGDGVVVVICVYPVIVDVPQTMMAEVQRCSMVIREEEGTLKIVHIHTSNPASPSPRLPLAARANYVLLHIRLAEETLKEYENLTPRQKVILELLAHGKTYGAIAEILSITPRTVRYHVSKLLTRFHATTKAELLAKVKRK